MQSRNYTQLFTTLGLAVRPYNAAKTTWANLIDSYSSQAIGTLNDSVYERTLAADFLDKAKQSKAGLDQISKKFKDNGEMSLKTIGANAIFASFSSVSDLIDKLNDAMQDDSQTIKGNTITTYNIENDTSSIITAIDLEGTADYTLTDNGKLHFNVFGSGGNTYIYASRVLGIFSAGALVMSGSIAGATGAVTLASCNSSGFYGSASVNLVASSTTIVVHLLPERDTDNQGCGANDSTAITAGQSCTNADWTMECLTAAAGTSNSRWKLTGISSTRENLNASSGFNADTEQSITKYGMSFTVTDPDTITVNVYDAYPYSASSIYTHSAAITGSQGVTRAVGGAGQLTGAQQFDTDGSVTIDRVKLKIAYMSAAVAGVYCYATLNRCGVSGPSSIVAQSDYVYLSTLASVAAMATFQFSAAKTLLASSAYSVGLFIGPTDADAVDGNLRWHFGGNYTAGQRWASSGEFGDVWTVASTTEDFNFEAWYVTGRVNPFSTWTISGRTDDNCTRASNQVTTGVYGTYGNLWARIWNDAGTIHTALFKTLAGATAGTATLCMASATGTGALTLASCNSSGLTGTVTVSYVDDITDGSIQLYYDLPFAVGDKLYFTTASDDAGVFQTYFRNVYQKTLPSVTDGTETIADSLAT